MELHKLVRMANEIGGFFEQLPDREEATKLIATHIKNFWEPRLRREIIQYARGNGTDLTELVRAAILSLEMPS